MALKIALYTPSYPPDVGGNATSTHRLVVGLQSRGVDVVVYRSGSSPQEGAWDGRIVHAFHAFRSGGPLLPHLVQTGPPFVVSIAGTDINQDLYDSEHAGTLKAVLACADAVIVMHSAQGERLQQVVPEVTDRIVEISPGIRWTSPEPVHVAQAERLRSRWGADKDTFVFLLPAGLRAVKRPLFAIEPLEALRRTGRRVMLVVLGAEVDSETVVEFDRAAAGRAWVKRLEPVPTDEMPAHYLAADAVLNTSLSEGLANAVIEAMALGRPVLVSDIEGNRACVDPEKSGLLFGDAQALYEAARRLVDDGELRRRLAARAQQQATRRYTTEQEVERHVEVYKSVCRTGR